MTEANLRSPACCLTVSSSTTFAGPQGVAVFVSAMAKTLARKVSRECDAFPANV